MKQGLLLPLLFVALVVLGQRTYHHQVFWGRVILADQLTHKLRGELFLQKRTQNIPGESSMFGALHYNSFCVWLTYPLTPNLKLSASPLGYYDSQAFLSKPSDVAAPSVREFRWAVRIEGEQPYKLFHYINRYILEYRSRDLSQTGTYVPNWRVRYMTRLEKPISGVLSKTKPVTLVLGDEVLIQFGKAVRSNPNVFDQNRLFAGVSYEMVRKIKVAVSYLNIMQQRSSGREFDQAHALWVVLTLDNLISQFKKRNTKTYQ
jgi:hypothetical protein